MAGGEGPPLRREPDERDLRQPGRRAAAVVYEGLFRVAVLLDTEKALGLPGGTFDVTGFQVQGRGLSANALGGNLMVASSIEASRGALLGEL